MVQGAHSPLFDWEILLQGWIPGSANSMLSISMLSIVKEAP